MLVKKTKTTKQLNNSKTEKNSYDIEQNTGSSEIENINKKAKNSVQNQNTSTEKGKGVGKKTKTTKQTSNLNTDKDLDDIEQNKLIKTSKIKKGTKESKRITKANPSKKMKRSPSIASTFVDSDVMSLHSDSDMQDLPSDFFSSQELIMSTIPKDEEELLLREKEIEIIVKEIRAEEKKIESKKNNPKNYTVMDKEIMKRKENEEKENILIETNITTQEKTQDRDDTKYPNKKDSQQSKKKINIISSVSVTPNESVIAKYSIRNLKMIDLNSDLHDPNPNKPFVGIQVKEDEPENTTEHPQQPTLYDVGDTVLARYFKNSWKYYVGTIKRVDANEKKYTISFHRAVGKNENVMFVVPKRIDEDYVPEENIVKTIELMQVNENPLQYVLLNDEDSVNF